MGKGKLEKDTKDFLDDTRGFFEAIAAKPEDFLDPLFAKDPEFVKVLRGAVAELSKPFEETKEAIDNLKEPLEKLDPILPLKMEVYKKITGKEDA